MERIGIDKVPELDGTDVLSAKRWFGALGDAGIRFHADDSVDDAATEGGGPLFTPEAADRINRTMEALHKARSAWPDPDFIYSLAGEGRFDVEAAYPGFVMDCSIPSASRTGYVTVPRQEFPTVLAEDMSEFVAIQIVPGIGRMSESTAFRVVPAHGVRFGRYGTIDASGIEIMHGEARETRSRDGLEGLVSEVVHSMAASRGPSR